MKTNRILTLLSVCGLFAGTATLNMVANYRNHSGNCQDGTCGRQHCHTCHSGRRSCESCPNTGHTHSYQCAPKPVCEKMVPVYKAPCKQCDTVTTCNYTCPVDTYEAGTCKEGESKAHATTAQQDKDGEMYVNGSAAAASAATEEEAVVAEEAQPAKRSRYARKMKNQ